MPESHWIFYPDFQASNPYQALLAAELSRYTEVHAGTVTDALECIGEHPTVFHVHWEDAVLARASCEQEARTGLQEFLAELGVFRDLGGSIVWTMHNAAPHEDRFPQLSVELREWLAQSADLVHVHGQTARQIARDAGAQDDRILCVAHPDLACAYPNDISREAARKYFHLGQEETVFSYIGAMRPYKGIDVLLRAFAKLRLKQPTAQLILAGRQPDHPEGRYFMVSPGIRVVPRFIDDGMVQYVFNAADYAVLPYKRILTSGAVALALGFGKPVIVPDLASLLEVVETGREALVFRTGDDDDLARVMAQACELGPEARRRLQDLALRNARATTFADLAGALIGGIRERWRDKRTSGEEAEAAIAWPVASRLASG